MKRRFKTEYFYDARYNRPDSKGFPKAEDGSAKGAATHLILGYYNKARCIDRTTGKTVWTMTRTPTGGIRKDRPQ